MSVLTILETLPTGAELRAERERTGDGLMTIKARHEKAAMLAATAAATNLTDLKIILARLIENSWRA